MKTENVEIAVLGAGIAGLGAAYRAKELSSEAVIFESRKSVGGLLDNFVIDGFRFDHAVHLSFAKEKIVRDIFDKAPYYTHPSDSFCFDKDRWLKHPVQNNLFPLAAKERVEMIKSFLIRPNMTDEDNYESWLRQQYGDAISERYPIRYTKKYWDTPASELSTSWISNRMRRAELEEILFGSLSPDTPNQYYTKEMRYPKTGGFKSFIQPLIDNSCILTDHCCTHIDTVNKVLSFSNGKNIKYKYLVNTLPLPELIKICSNVPDDVKKCSNFLKATSIDLISVGFNKNLTNDLWFYIYDEDILASRAHSPSKKSPANAPKNCSSLQFEIYNRGTEPRFDKDVLVNNTIMALGKMKIANEDDIVVMDHRRLPYGNVIFDRGMEKNRQRVLDWTGAMKISSCGRFGSWDYLWSNQSFISGYESVDIFSK